MTKMSTNIIAKKVVNTAYDIALSVLKHSNDKRETKAVGYKPLSVSSPEELITPLNTYHCTFADLKDGKRDDDHVERIAPVITLDVDKEGDALKDTLAILDELDLEYVKVPSQSDMDYKAHIIVMCSGVYHDDNPLKLKAGYGIQVEQFITDTGIDISWLDELPLFATSGYLAPASCGKLTVAQANAKSIHHPGKPFELLDLEGNGIVVPEKSDKRSRKSVKGLAKVEGEKFDLKDVESKINILEADNTIYHYGKLVKLKDAVAYIKNQNDPNVIYGGFGCPRCNTKHTINPKTTPYAFAFISDKGDGDVMFKCTGNECSDKPLFIMDKLTEESKTEVPKKVAKRYVMYKASDHNGGLRVAFYDKEKKEFIKPTRQSKQPYYSLNGAHAKATTLGIVRKETNDKGFKAYLMHHNEVEIIRDGFKKRGFDNTSEKGKKIFWDAPVPKFEVEEMDATPIVGKALSIFKDDHKTAGVSTALLLIASYLFGKKQSMAVLGFVGDPASGKTFYAQELMIEYWGHEWVGSVVPDDNNWGDAEFGKRHICYNDVDRMTEHRKKALVGKVKRKATEGEHGKLNMKGGAVVDSTQMTQSITSNYAEALPIDAEGKDRRVYIPKLDLEGVDHAELAKAFDPKIGGSNARENRRDLICHLYQLWNKAQKTDKEAVQHLLFVEVPSTEEKQDLMAESVSDAKALLIAIEGKDNHELEDAIAPFIKDTRVEEFEIGENAKAVAEMIIKERVDAEKYWFLPQDLLAKIRTHMTSFKGEGEATLTDTARAFVGKRQFNNLSVNKIPNQRGIKIKK